MCIFFCLFLSSGKNCQTAKRTTMFMIDFSSTMKEECEKFKLIYCAFTQEEAASFKTITQKTYPLINVLHKGNGTSWHKAFPAHQEKATDWCQLFGFSEPQFLWTVYEITYVTGKSFHSSSTKYDRAASKMAAEEIWIKVYCSAKYLNIDSALGDH